LVGFGGLGGVPEHRWHNGNIWRVCLINHERGGKHISSLLSSMDDSMMIDPTFLLDDGDAEAQPAAPPAAQPEPVDQTAAIEAARLAEAEEAARRQAEAERKAAEEAAVRAEAERQAAEAEARLQAERKAAAEAAARAEAEARAKAEAEARAQAEAEAEARAKAEAEARAKAEAEAGAKAEAEARAKAEAEARARAEADAMAKAQAERVAAEEAAAARKAAEDEAAKSAAQAAAAEQEEVSPMEKCAAILEALVKRKDASWFREPVPADTEGYSLVVSTPMDYGTIRSKLEAGAYADAAAFAADVRLVASNAIAYSPGADDDCHIAARANLVAFEKGFVKAHLATDGGAAAAAAEAAMPSTKPPPRTGRKRNSDAAELDQA
jgi:chemotaxis protein histidine kinase CheA